MKVEKELFAIEKDDLRAEKWNYEKILRNAKPIIIFGSSPPCSPATNFPNYKFWAAAPKFTFKDHFDTFRE